ncbi:MAG: tetratricopeptide repeat protein [Thermodesulfobacteriota bacterium]
MIARGLRYAFGAALVLVLAAPMLRADATVDRLVFEAADLHYKGEIDKAADMFEKAAAADPKNVYVQNQLGVINVKKKNYAAALKNFSRVAALDPRNTFAMRWMGLLLLREGKMEEARVWFEKALSVDKKDADAYYFLGTLYYLAHNPEKAIFYLKKARDADSDEAETHYRLGGSFADVGMVKNAQLEYLRALAISKRHTRTKNALGWVLYNQEDVEGAMAQWRETLDISPQDTEARENLARANNSLAWQAFSSGNRIAAKRYWQQTLVYDPKNKAATYYLDMIKQ